MAPFRQVPPRFHHQELFDDTLCSILHDDPARRWLRGVLLRLFAAAG